MTCSNWRGVEERLSHMLNHPPGKVGMCARECWQALGGDLPNPCPPAWGTPDANAVYGKVLSSGRYWTDANIPRGALILWKYEPHGHAALSAGGGKIVTTDPPGKPGGTGYAPLSLPESWGANPKHRIYTDQYNGVRFDIGGDVAGIYDGGFHGAETTLKVGTSYVRLVGGAEWNPKRDGLQLAKLYFKASDFVFKSGKTRGGIKVKCVRENPTDPTFYDTVPVDVDWLDGGALNHSFASFEQGEHERNLHFEVKCVGGLTGCTLATTRYAGWAVIGD